MSWDERAACRAIGRAGEQFFPTPGRASRGVRNEMCAWCPVREDCLEAGVSSEWMPSGIWGGLEESEVVKLWRRRKRYGSRLVGAS